MGKDEMDEVAQPDLVGRDLCQSDAGNCRLAARRDPKCETTKKADWLGDVAAEARCKHYTTYFETPTSRPRWQWQYSGV